MRRRCSEACRGGAGGGGGGSNERAGSNEEVLQLLGPGGFRDMEADLPCDANFVASEVQGHVQRDA